MATGALSRPKIPVIIDTDPGVDDTVAILMALTSPELEILGYTISFGNTDMDASYSNIYRIYQAVQKEMEQNPEARSRFPGFFQNRKPFLARGAHGPLGGDLHTAQYFHGRDGLGNATQTHPDINVPLSVIESQTHPQLEPTNRPGHLVGLDMLREFPARDLTYIVLGPMTNLALMMREDAQCVRDKIGRVVVMGGALDVPGNTSPVAEFNFFADPYAVAELLEQRPSGELPPPHQGLPLSRVLILPLDITTPHELSFPLYAQRIDTGFRPDQPSIAAGKSPIIHFSSTFLQRTREVMLEFGNDAMELHDVVAVWAAAKNPPVQDDAEEVDLGLMEGWGATRRKFAMERTGELARGMCIVDRRFDERAYAPGANRAEVQEALDREHIKHGPFESTAVPAQVEVENQVQMESLMKGSEGVPVVTRTPGSDALVQILFERIWGVKD